VRGDDDISLKCFVYKRTDFEVMGKTLWCPAVTKIEFAKAVFDGDFPKAYWAVKDMTFLCAKNFTHRWSDFFGFEK